MEILTPNTSQLSRAALMLAFAIRFNSAHPQTEDLTTHASAKVQVLPGISPSQENQPELLS